MKRAVYRVRECLVGTFPINQVCRKKFVDSCIVELELALFTHQTLGVTNGHRINSWIGETGVMVL
jgi:hypothetical protein